MSTNGDDERGFFSERWIEPPAKEKAANEKSAETPHYHGHRDRLRERFVAGGPDALPDYELLELLLFRLIPRVDTKPIAKALLARFGTFGEVLGAPVALLQEVKGIGPAVAVDLKVIAAAAQRMARTEVRDREVLSNWTQLLAYIRSAMAFENREQFRILFLDKKNVLIADEVQQVGTVDHTPVYPREVIKRALELSASAVILVHNHHARYPTGMLDHNVRRVDLNSSQNQ